jgi:hypothetical protein
LLQVIVYCVSIADGAKTCYAYCTVQELDGIDASPASFHRHCLALVAHQQQQQQQQQYDHEAETSALGSYYDYRSAAEHSSSAIPPQQRMSSAALFGSDASDISADDGADVLPFEENSSYDQVHVSLCTSLHEL